MKGIYERNPGSGIWWIHYYDAEGKRRREKAGTKSVAVKLYQKRKVEAASGKKLPASLRLRQRTFGEFCDLALVYSNAHKRSSYDDSHKIAILRAEFGDRVAESLTQQEFAAFLDSRDTSPATFNRYRATLSMIYREAIRNEWTERNPARLIKSKTEPSGRIRYLLDEEEAKLRKVMDTDYVPFRPEFDIALHTGMRKHEQFACRWDWVEVKSKRIILPGEIAKNGKSRVVRLNADAIAALEQQRTVTGSESHVFMSPTGKPYPDKVIRGWFDDACYKAGIKNFTWHCLRHTFCSRLVMAGVDLKTVQELAGHLTISVTARYSHLSQQHLETAIEKISTIHRGESTATKTATKKKTTTKC